MPRPRSLTAERLALAALAALDEDGPAGLTMRAVAQRLGMSTMALYRYVNGREDLERLVVDAVLDAADPAPPPAGLPWRERAEIMALRMRAAVACHPSAAPLTIVHRQSSRPSLRWAETVLGILTDAGFTGLPRAAALRALIAYLVGAIQVEHLGALAGPGTAVLADLSPADYPLLRETAQTAAALPPETEFRTGLTALLHGLSPGISVPPPPA